MVSYWDQLEPYGLVIACSNVERSEDRYPLVERTFREPTFTRYTIPGPRKVERTPETEKQPGESQENRHAQPKHDTQLGHW